MKHFILFRNLDVLIVDCGCIPNCALEKEKGIDFNTNDRSLFADLELHLAAKCKNYLSTSNRNVASPERICFPRLLAVH